MNTKEIEALLEQYYEGNTSLQGEKILREYFQGDDIAENLKVHQPLFMWVGQEKNVEITSRDFDTRIDDQLSNQKNNITEKTQKISGRRKFLYFTGIAASFLLVIVGLYVYKSDVGRQLSVKEEVSTELAYIETIEALNIVSSNLNVGLVQASRIQMLDKGMKNILLLNKFYQVQSVIINPDVMNNPSQKQK